MTLNVYFKKCSVQARSVTFPIVEDSRPTDGSLEKVSANMRDFRHFEKHNISYLLARMTCRYLPDSEVFLADTYKQSKSI